MTEPEDTSMAEIGVDRISALPDSILCHILSFLPTIHCVATCLVSKRWTHLWRFVPALRFIDDKDLEGLLDNEASFRLSSLVYSVLLSRDPTQPIRSFRLNTSRNLVDFFNLNKWISAVLQRRVQLLSLCIYACGQLRRLPHGILSSKTLEVLILHGFYIKNFPAVSLPALKALHFFEIKFPHSRCLVEILAACPILEVFAVECVQWDNHDTITYQDFKHPSFAAKLVNVTVNELDNIVFPLKLFSNVKFLCTDTTQVYGGDLDIPTFHNLTRLDLIFFHYRYDWDLIMKLLKNSPKLQFLIFSQPRQRNEMDPEKGADPEFVPECLLLHLRTCTMEDFLGLQHEHLLARYIMKNAKVLRSMAIKCKEGVGEEEVQMIKEKLSSCQRSSATCQLLIC